MKTIITFFANIFGYLLNYIYGFVNNYGLAIIIFTIILKLVMLPISIKQQKSMKKNSQMQKKIMEIQDKYSNDQARQSQELMDLYKKEHYNPFSGCLTSIIQMFLVLSMFYLVSQPLTYMKQVETEKIDNYVTQITNEGKNVRYREIAVIKEMRDKDESVKINMDFLGLDLSDIPSENYTNWKVYIIPVLYVFTSFVSTKIITLLTKDPKEIAKEKEEKALIKQEEKKENKETEAMSEMNKQMQLMVPIMSVSIALIAPLGLALYWLVGNLFSLCERLILNKFFKKGEEKEDNG
jgi:YidC/Oxa1 family membrane protein insertase